MFIIQHYGNRIINTPNVKSYSTRIKTSILYNSRINISRSFTVKATNDSKKPFDLHLFRSLWGTELISTDYRVLLPKLIKSGYNGIEASIDDINVISSSNNVTKPITKDNDFWKLMKDLNLKLIVGAYTSWPDYKDLFEDHTVGQHLERLKTEIDIINNYPITPIHINIHSGQDNWTEKQNLEFYSKAIDLQSSLTSISCSHETHRGRSLYNPYTTYRLIEQLPNLRLTADFSHWIVVCERLLNHCEADKQMMNTIRNHVSHIHARIGTAQQPQYDSPMNSIEREFFYSQFELIWHNQFKSYNTNYTTITPEYGPKPYTPFNSITGEPLYDVIKLTDFEAHNIRKLFNQFTSANNICPSST